MGRVLRVSLFVVGLVALTYLVGTLVGERRPERAVYQRIGDRVLVHAHQGGDHLWPGNTLVAFEGAAALGVDILELDVHLSADGIIVVLHDDTVDRTTNGSGAVAAMRYEEIGALDGAYRWRPPGAPADAFPYRGQGIMIPTLDEVLEAFPDFVVNVELKVADPRLGDAVCDLLRRGGRTESVIVASFHDGALRHFRDRCPDVATSAGPGEIRAFYAFNLVGLGRWTRPAADAFQVPVRQGNIEIVTPRMVRGLRERNVRLDVWTINDEAEMRRLLDLGVGGIITDRPDLALTALGR